MLLAVYYRVMEHVGSLESTQEAHPCDFKSNSRCALVRFWNHAYDFSPNCTLLCSITIINTRREIPYLRVPMYYSLLNCGILQGFPAPRKNRNNTGEKLRRFFTCEIFFKGLPSLEKLPVRRVQVVVFMIYKIYLTLFVVFISCYGSLVRSFVPQELPSGL